MPGKTITNLLVLGVIVYLLVIAALYVWQESLMFPGKKLPDDFRFELSMPFTEHMIEVEGGAINALHFQQPDADGVVFFLHGNGGNLDGWTENIEWYQRNNYDLFIIDYRGYGKSLGRITSQQQLMDDVRAAWRVMQPHYPDKPIVLYGRSLGAALAAQLATEVEADLLVLVSPFTSMLAMAAELYPFVPSALVRYPLRTDEIIDQITMPILLIHGDQDTFIPIAHSQSLFDKAGPGARLLTIEGAGHNDIHNFSSYLGGLAAVLPVINQQEEGRAAVD